MRDISEKNIIAFHQDMDALGILRPDRMPRATQCLDGIRNLIEELVGKGVAYSIDGNVYFAVMKNMKYGRLSGRNLEDQQQNADGRLTDSERSSKNNSFDFALWKKAKKGEPSFPSPWGDGRPGWHIECSAMVLEELGETIDIHLGGADLIFPHHENEIAQSESATGKELANFWLHNGMVNVDGQKMSKSLGNFTTIRALLENGISPMTVRLFVLQAHYRKPLDFSSEGLKAASSGWAGLNKSLSLGIVHYKLLGWPKLNSNSAEVVGPINSKLSETLNELNQRFSIAMDDDLNTSSALAVLFDLAKPLRSIANQLDRGEEIQFEDLEGDNLYSRWQLLLNLAGVLGLKPEGNLNVSSKDCALTQEDISTAIQRRKEAKLSKDFEKADQIRKELNDIGIELIDKPGGITEWLYK